MTNTIKIQAGRQFWLELYNSEFGLYEDSIQARKDGKPFTPEAIELIQELSLQRSEFTGKLMVSEELARHILWCLDTNLDKWQGWAAEDIRNGHLVRSAYKMQGFLRAVLAEIDKAKLPVSKEGEEPFAHEYTFCPQCDGEVDPSVEDGLAICPKHGADCILPPNHRVRVAHRQWVAELNAKFPPKPEPVTIIITTAPEAYDYGYCISRPLPWTRKGNQVREVTVPADCAKHQAGRYRSGMYEAMTPEEFEEWQDLYEPTSISIEAQEKEAQS